MTMDTLVLIWFGLIAILWVGYFILDGFDQGVGVLLPFLGKDELRRLDRCPRTIHRNA